MPALEETEAEGAGRTLTLREQMTRHRTEEPCASCHKLMDPIGFALENFNADAQWRTHDGGDEGNLIDATVELFDGTQVNGPSELRAALLKYSPQFARMVTEKMMTYALGRGVEYFDMPVVRSIVREAENEEYSFSSILMGIVNSDPFQMRTKSGEMVANIEE